MKELQGPFPGPAFFKQIARHVMPPLQGIYSGEVLVNLREGALGAARFAAQITNAWFSAAESGRSEGENLSGEVDVYINGTSIFSTKPAIAGNSGEASANKTTKVTGDTGIIVGVVNPDSGEVSIGDVITWSLDITRTNPDTEMKNVVVVVEFEPNRF